jgi:hypothetical protein
MRVFLQTISLLAVITTSCPAVSLKPDEREVRANMSADNGGTNTSSRVLIPKTRIRKMGKAITCWAGPKTATKRN